MSQIRDRAGPKRFAVHNSGIKFIRFNVRKDGTTARVEMRIVLEHAYSGLRDVETRSAAFENFVTRRQRALDSGTIFALTFWRHFAALDRSSKMTPEREDRKNTRL